MWAFPCALSLCSVAPGRYVTGSAFAPASALTHFIRLLAVAAFGALHSANALLIVEKSKYLTYSNLMNTAILSSFDKYTTFSFGGKTLTFRTCNGLERYTKVLQWDDGYIEVMAKYKNRKEEIEEYIDLIPVLEGLYMDKEKFLAPIKEVKIEYA